MNLRRIFSALYFVNTNLPEQWIRKLLYKKELSDLPDCRSDIFKKINIGQYILKDQTQHSGMVNTMLWMIYGMHNYALEKEPNKTCEYHVHKWDDILIKRNNEECLYPKILNQWFQ